MDEMHIVRPRLNQLFMKAVKYPLVVVCAGAGYGKTSAVHDFAGEYDAIIVWIQLSERDNVGARFWENCIHTIKQINEPLARVSEKLGFPDTKDKFKQYMSMVDNYVEKKKQIVVLDDFHCIKDSQVLHFLKECFLLKIPPETSVFLLSRSSPQINAAKLHSKELMFTVNENDLRFTDDELSQYFRSQNISAQPEYLREIIHDTEGWAFAVNLVVRSYQKAPGYAGYMRSAMKTNIFSLMETEIWDEVSGRLQVFMVRLALIDHLSVDFISLLAGGDESLIDEFERQSAYVRRDSYINAYLIHPLLLEFLSTKHNLLSDEQKKETYSVAGEWCNQNGFKIDALSYYEKTGDYKSIVSMFFALPAQVPEDIARIAAAIFDRAPPEAFETTEFLAVMHLRSYMCQGLWQKSTELAEFYEKKFLKFPPDDPFGKLSLSGLYFCWGFLRSFLSVTDGRYDFDQYFEKFFQNYVKPFDANKLVANNPGFWINYNGSSRKGAPEEYIDALARTTNIVSRYTGGLNIGHEDLARGELKFYQGDVYAAEPFIIRALNRSREFKHDETVQKTLFYMLRLRVARGNYIKTEQTLNDLKVHLDGSEYIDRFINYEIALSWYYYILGLPEKMSDWLKDNFTPYAHAGFVENFKNQMKGCFYYSIGDFLPLLSHMEEAKKRESYLFDRVELLAMEACVHYKMKNKAKAYAALLNAYKEAVPNNIFMPFIELGKDMRTLASSALKGQAAGIPKSWLDEIGRKSALYAKRRSHIITEYKQKNQIEEKIYLSPREQETLIDLSHGLSRTEIAESQNRSINTVKMVINNLHLKLGAENLADLIRIAVERKMI